ncbi:MAG: hypothetical protein CMJ69_00900 [Planctomycetaceae bacterium]|nr:hypothetical protein [Planctomycetaceae bacterium]
MARLGAADTDQLLEEVGGGVRAVPRLGGDGHGVDNPGDRVGLAGVALPQDLDLPQAQPLVATPVPAGAVPIESYRLGLLGLVVFARADGFGL